MSVRSLSSSLNTSLGSSGSNGTPTLLSPPVGGNVCSTVPPSVSPRYDEAKQRLYDLDLEKILNAMEKGHRICKLALGKRWEPAYRRLYFSRETRQLMLTKNEALGMAKSAKPSSVDIRQVKEVQTLEYKVSHIGVYDKWKRDRELMQFDTNKVLVFQFGTGFIPNVWICLFETPDACRLWVQGVQHLMQECFVASHPLLVERWLRKEFYNIANPNTLTYAYSYIFSIFRPRIIHKLRITKTDISTNNLISVLFVKTPPPNKLKPKIMLQSFLRFKMHFFQALRFLHRWLEG